MVNLVSILLVAGFAWIVKRVFFTEPESDPVKLSRRIGTPNVQLGDRRADDGQTYEPNVVGDAVKVK
jgi:hypothetical protein